MSESAMAKNGFSHEKDRIAEMYAGKNLFMTGGTGFLGKVLVEKLLRVCPDIGNIYILVRVKKGKNPKDRVEEIFNSPLFELVRKMRPQAINHLKVIHGDVSSPDLGISKYDREMLADQVNIVYHCAASTRFDDPLKRAVIMNTRATKLVLDLAQEFKHLQAFVHVSTAFCHVEHTVLHEQIYDPPDNPHDILRSVATMNEPQLAALEAEILKQVPNTYVYTKALGETLVAERMDRMPCIIVRPSVVLSMWIEPIPGWSNNLLGPVGLIVAAGKGIVRSMYYPRNNVCDLIPVDYCVNNMIVATWNYIYNKEVDKRVYNMTTGSEMRYDWSAIIETGRRLTKDIPLNGVVWYPGGSMKRSRFVHNVCCLFQHWIPAYFLDALIFLSGNKPCLVDIQGRLSKGMEVFEYFSNNEWDFRNDNIIAIRSKLNERETATYKINTQGFDLEKYFEDCIHSTRTYVLNMDPKTLPAARRHLKVMWGVELIFKLLCVWLVVHLVTSYSETANSGLNYVVGYAKSFLPPSIMGSSAQ